MNWLSLGHSVTGDHQNSIAELSIKHAITGIYIEHRCLTEFVRSGNHNDIFKSHPSYDACTNLLVTPPKDKPLCTNRAENNFCRMNLVEQRPECFFIDIPNYCFPVFYSINAKKGFVHAKLVGNGFRSCPCAEDIEYIRDHNFADKTGDFTF